jgi:hypothetical protein
VEVADREDKEGFETERDIAEPQEKSRDLYNFDIT